MRNIAWLPYAMPVFCFAAAAPANSAPAAALKLNSATCKPLAEPQRAWLPEGWIRFAPFVFACPVTRGKTPALWVVSVWAGRFYVSQPAETPAVAFPKPLLLSKDGGGIGEIPINYPDDPPRSVDLIFSKWTGNFPHEIQVWVEDPTVRGSRFLPSLVWNPSSGRFVVTHPPAGKR